MPKKSVAKNYLYNLTYQVLILVLPLITTPYISRVLGAEGIGIYGYTYSIVSYFILFGSLGVALYGQREIAYASENKGERSRIFLEILIFRFFTMFISIAIYYFTFIKGTQYTIYYKILLFELIAAAFDISWFFQGLEEFKKTVARNILVRIVSVALVFILVKNSEDLVKYTLIYSLADFIGNLTLWFYLPKYFKGQKINNINIKRHLAPIILLFIPQIANQIYNMLDKTMIGKIIEDKSEVGYYEQSQKVIRLLLTIVTSLGTVMIPRMASTFASGNKEKVNQYMKNSFRFVFFLAYPLMFGIISISGSFVPIFFGKGYEKSEILINILSPIVLLMGVANVVGTQYLLPTKRQKEYTISIALGVVTNFILNSILITLFNSIGACIATILSQLAVDALQLYRIRNDINVKEMMFSGKKYFISSIVMFIVCCTIGKIMGNGSITMAIQIFLGVISYIVILFVLKDEYLKLFIEKVRKRVLGTVRPKH